MRKSYLFGGLCCVVVVATTWAHFAIGSQLAKEIITSGTSYRLFARQNQTVKADSLKVVGWATCPFCVLIKTTTIPALVAQGYDVKYVELRDWKGPKVTVGPTLFYYANGKVVKTETGLKTASHVKQYLTK